MEGARRAGWLVAPREHADCRLEAEPARPGRGGPGAVALTAFRVVITLAVTLVISQFYRTTLAAIAPELMHELTLSAGELGLASSAFFLAFAAMQIPVGMLLDRFGPRRTVPSLLILAVTGAITISQAEGFAFLATSAQPQFSP